MNDPKPIVIPGIGVVKPYFARTELPTIRRVLQVFFHFHRKEKETVIESSVIVSKLVAEIYVLKGLPVQRTWMVQKKIRDLYSSWRSLQKSSQKTGNCYDKMRACWETRIGQVFDITHQQPSSSQVKNEDDRQPEPKVEELNDEAESSESEKDEDEDWEDPEGPVRKKRRIFPLSDATLTLLDRSMVKDSAAATLLTASIVDLGLNSEQLSTSASTIRRHREMARIKNEEKNVMQFEQPDALVVHIDTKQMKKGRGQMEERLAVTVSGNNNEQLLGVPVVPSGSGRDIAAGVYQELKKYNLSDCIKGISYDTTASNTGKHNGAVTLLEQHIGRQLLHLPCRHHIFELILEAAFSAALKEKSNGPDIGIFKRFQKAWSTIDPTSFEPMETCTELSSSDKSTIETTAKYFLKNAFVRADYKELLHLILLFIGVDSYEDREITVKAPGAMHRARWMARAIYSFKIYLFRSQFALISREKQAMGRICLFIVKVYVHAWYSAPLSAAAPRNDLKLLKLLKDYKSVDNDIGTATELKMRRHMDYLSETNVCFALFDEGTPIAEKRKMVQNLSRSSTGNREDRLSDFVSVKSMKFFEILEISANRFLGFDPTEWGTIESYRQAKQLCLSLAVVNDSAERAVALGQKYNDFATTDEKQKQAILTNVFANRKEMLKLSKGSIVGVLSSN